MSPRQALPSVANELVSLVSLGPTRQPTVRLRSQLFPDSARPVFIILASLSLIAHTHLRKHGVVSYRAGINPISRGTLAHAINLWLFRVRWPRPSVHRCSYFPREKLSSAEGIEGGILAPLCVSLASLHRCSAWILTRRGIVLRIKGRREREWIGKNVRVNKILGWNERMYDVNWIVLFYIFD